MKKKCFLFVLLFFLNTPLQLSFAAGCSSSGVCTYIKYTAGTVYVQKTLYASAAYNATSSTSCSIIATSAGSNNSVNYPTRNIAWQIYQFDSLTKGWALIANRTAYFTDSNFSEMINQITARGGGTQDPGVYLPDGCLTDVCDTSDSDGDGVCNACDKLPTAPDPEDCILGEAVGSDGNLSGVVIDEGCTNIQENFVYWGGDNFQATDKWMWHIGNNSEQLGRQTCHAGGTEGNCCAYSEGSLGAQKTVGLSPAGAMPSPTVEQMVDDLTDLPAPEDLPSNCSGHNAQCEKMCQDKLGVGFSFCREDDLTHETTSQCKCNTDLQYDLATPQDEKTNPTEDKYDQDSNGNAVPDYADDSLLGQGDTDGDHITNKADVDSTNGPDSNKDGIDDNYQATAKAVAHAGLSISDSANLHDIETNTANTVASVNNLGTKIGKILDGMTAQQIKDQEYQAKITSAADSFTESNTPSVAGADETTFGTLDEHALPIDDSEDFDIDAYLAQFNYMSEMHDAIINSKVEISSANSCVDNTIHGSHVSFCFNMFEHWFLIMGQILKALAVFRGFDIVVTGGRGFGG